jgi:hypothetical protein
MRDPLTAMSDVFVSTAGFGADATSLSTPDLAQEQRNRTAIPRPIEWWRHMTDSRLSRRAGLPA